MGKNTFYITTTLPYVNADLHIGHAAEMIRADIWARYQKKMGKEVLLNTGTDEHGQKILNSARQQGCEPQVFVDKAFLRFKEQVQKMGLDEDFLKIVRTTDSQHQTAAQEFWRRCEVKGDIYKKNYTVKYCVGCELEKTDSELVDGECPLHPGKPVEKIEEENYFFRFSNYEEKLLKLYRNRSDFIKPDFRLNEITKFVERGLQDFSISRLKEKMPWGVPVPNDNSQVMSVWFDALVNYISTLGWPDDQKNFEKWWPVIQVCGKDNLRQQTAMWQAMLMSAGLEPSKQIHVFGFINSGGQKMSKSIGNVISPLEIIDEYGMDTLRYYVARHLNMYEDSDLTMEKFKEVYNGNLANGLGNLASRVMKMAEIHLDEPVIIKNFSFSENAQTMMNNFELNNFMDYVWSKISKMDTLIQQREPFKLIKTSPDLAINIIKGLILNLYEISVLLEFVLPETAQKIQTLIRENKTPSEPLFIRK